MFCLPQQVADIFKAKLKTGEIDPTKLVEMTTEERNAFFSEFLGEANAKSVNTLFESKLLLKNQQQGIINWAKQVIGMKPEVLRDIISKVDRMTSILQPKDLNSFLGDLAAQKLGVGVTLEEAGKIAELSKKVSETKTAMNEGGDRMAYGHAVVEMHNYINDLKQQATKISVTDFKENPLGTAGKIAKEIPGIAKSLKASLDDSALGRQGWKTLFTNPSTWTKNALQSFVDIARTFGGKEVMNEVNADIASRENSTNGLYKKAKLAVGTIEESFPSTIQEKIPIVGRAFKAADVAYTAFIHRMRADVFDKYIEIAKKANVDLTDKTQLESIGKLVNSLTGRGNLGKLEPAANAVNNVFFSPRKLKSDFDFLTAHQFQKDVTLFVRQQAAINLAKVVGGVSAILAIANAIKPGSVETDPRSADFGKIKIGHTRFDVTGGMASLLTLAVRILTMSSKSSTTGKVNPLNSGKYGAQTGWDVLLNFGENKLSPASSVFKDVLKGQDFQGNKPTFLNETGNLLMPLPITNYQELMSDPKAAPLLAGLLADALGISVNTYGAFSTSWENSTSAEIKGFKEKVTPAQFKEANTRFNQEFSNWLDSVKDTPKYTDLSDADKQSVQTSKKAEIRAKILKDYGFTYKPAKHQPLPKF